MQWKINNILSLLFKFLYFPVNPCQTSNKPIQKMICSKNFNKEKGHHLFFAVRLHDFSTILSYLRRDQNYLHPTVRISEIVRFS